MKVKGLVLSAEVDKTDGGAVVVSGQISEESAKVIDYKIYPREGREGQDDFVLALEEIEATVKAVNSRAWNNRSYVTFVLVDINHLGQLSRQNGAGKVPAPSGV